MAYSFLNMLAVFASLYFATFVDYVFLVYQNCMCGIRSRRSGGS